MEQELRASIWADPAGSRISEIKQKRGDPLPPFPPPSLGGNCGINDAPAPEAWHYAGTDILGLLLPTATHRSPSLPTEYNAELKLATELRAGPKCSIWRPRADERELPRY
ncbi:hypothetical protein NDU88_000725 [Pleurodeles waltl]|uniref:Uncharacterized protein n=1 Tax=Pleurodeles waltl TaxID=8319 RepID=A0AAV7R531_PLEWA|nr:hypothetical protein NDU88_000725 [Pleurodeles waltl]